MGPSDVVFIFQFLGLPYAIRKISFSSNYRVDSRNLWLRRSSLNNADIEL